MGRRMIVRTYGGVISFELQFLLELPSEDVQRGLYGPRGVQHNLLHRLFRHVKAQLGKYLPVHMQTQASQSDEHAFLVGTTAFRRYRVVKNDKLAMHSDKKQAEEEDASNIWNIA